MIFHKQRKKLLLELLALRRKNAIVSQWEGRRARAKLQAKQLSNKAGVPPETYCRWINGDQEPGEEGIKLVQAALEKEGV